MQTFSRFLFGSSVISAALAANTLVTVGLNGLTYTPNFVTGVAGDTVTFEFHPKNHTLTQSTFAAPCTPVAGGGNSGFMPVAAGATTFPTKQLVIPDATTPLWFYCAQPGHCGQGMVFAINPGTQTKMDSYVANAKATVTGGTTTSAPPAASTPPASTTTTDPSAASSTGTTGTTGSTAPKTINIAVGQGGALTFTPDRTAANIGDTLLFTFMAGAHTVTQSTFADPCDPMAGGFDSGSKPVAGLTTPPTFSLTVNATTPTWIYCKTGTHCRSGMVMSINPPATGNTADAFHNNAISGAGASGSATVSGAQASQTPGGGAAARFASGASALVVASLVAGLLL